MRGGKARPKTGFCFHVQKRPMPECSGVFFCKEPHLEIRTKVCPGSRKSCSGSVSATSTDSRKMGSHGVSVADVSGSATSSPSSSVVQVGHLHNFR